MQRIPHDATKYRNNPVELVNIANRQRIGWLLDPYTKLLIPGNGANGSTAITDLTGKALTVIGNTNISTSQSIIGGSSIYFDGSGGYLSLADSDDWDFGSGDFTVDFWSFIPNASSPDWPCIMEIGITNNSIEIVQHVSGLLYGLAIKISGTWYKSLVALSSNTWQHLCFVRNGNNLKIFISGTQVGSTFNVTGVSVSSSGIITIGKNDSINSFDDYFNGYLSHIRISKGIARWTSNFTPPSKISDYYQMNNYIGA